jgi:hypothetical protein
MSTTSALIVLEPPVAGTVCGSALSVTRPTAAVPTRIFNPPDVPVFEPPEMAVIVAVPFSPPARNVAVTCPLTSVVAADGWICPSVVTKVICVPECGGKPDGSRTCAMIGVDPFAESVFVLADSVIEDPVGANSGCFSQPAKSASGASANPRRKIRR